MLALNANEEQDKSDFRIIYYIHGDGSYKYHNSAGKEIYADIRMLRQANYTAKKQADSEVYIFHQATPQKFLFLFPQKNSRFYFYKNGILKSKKNISIKNESEGFDYLMNKVRENTKGDSIDNNFLLYYGHTIPEIADTNSNEKQFTINEFAAGVGISGLNYDMIVLSTCNNGTIYTVKSLLPYSKYIIASPAELHLSNITSLPLIKLKRDNYNARKFAFSFARYSFHQLEFITTQVAISLYDSEKLKPFFEGYKAVPLPYQSKDCIDCMDINADFPKIHSAVKVFYKPPVFGRDKNKKYHSGWGCSL